MEITTIQIEKGIHKRLKIIAANTGKKLYELIADAVSYLEDKYRE